MASTVASRKAKSRRLQNDIAERIRSRFGLPTEDVQPVPMGVNGMDIKLSSAAREVFPIAIEAKNRESFSIWEAMRQAEENADGLVPAAVFKRNRSKTYICLEFDKFLELIGA